MENIKIMSNKERRYLKHHSTNYLRKYLIELTLNKPEQRVCVMYKDKNCGIGIAKDLLENSSNDFMALLKLDIQEVIKGKTFYIIL